MTALADAVLPLIRTRSELHRWGASNAHGRQMHRAVDILAAAEPTTDAHEFYDVTHRALNSAITVIKRADDSSGIIGDACRRLLAMHPGAAFRARVPPGRLADWMIKFQFYGEVDYFTLDPVTYASALGAKGVETYRSRLASISDRIGPEPTADIERTLWQRRVDQPGAWDSFISAGVARRALEWNQQRLAVLDRDVEGIIRTHAKDQQVAAWLENTARALAEIEEIDQAIDWARRATYFDLGHQSSRAAEYWCQLLSDHRPEELVDARLEVFRRWPSSSTAAALYQAAEEDWPAFQIETLEKLQRSPRDAVLFALNTLGDLSTAWDWAHALDLDDDRLWRDLTKAYEKVDPLAVLPVYAMLVDNELVEADAEHYRYAARRLAKMRRLAEGTGEAAGVDRYIAELRETHRRRPRLQLEFDKAGLP